MSKREEYTCIRCNYSTNRKSSMHKHLFELKKECPATKNKIVLTDEIKNEIMKNRVYLMEVIPIAPPPSIQPINQFIINMDTIDKIQCVLDHDNKKLVGYGDQLEQANKVKIERFENNDYNYGFKMTMDDYLELIDKSVKINGNDFDKMNLLFLGELNKIALFRDDEWETYLMEAGLKVIISILRDYYLNSFERYLLTTIFSPDTRNGKLLHESNIELENYYKFLAYFDVTPALHERENYELVPSFKHENENYLDIHCMKIYNEIKSKLNKAEISKMKREVVDIIKRNTNVNIKYLNKRISDRAINDANFKSKLYNLALP